MLVLYHFNSKQLRAISMPNPCFCAVCVCLFVVFACVAVSHNVAAAPPPIGPVGLAEPYKSGHATEMLEQSLHKLKVHETDDFRAQAGKIISFMLENRLPSGAKSVAASKSPPSVNKPSVASSKPQGPHLKVQLPPLAYASETHFEERFPKITAPPPPALSQSPPLPMPPTPPPPPPTSQPPPLSLLVPHPDYSGTTMSSTSPTTPPLPLPPPPPPSMLTTLGNNAEQERAPVVLRQRNGGVKSAHARDRRSFIENGDGRTIYNALNSGSSATTALDAPLPMESSLAHGDRDVKDGGNVVRLENGGCAGGHTTADGVCGSRSTISDDGLWNGAPPVCCVCQTRIQR